MLTQAIPETKKNVLAQIGQRNTEETKSFVGFAEEYLAHEANCVIGLEHKRSEIEYRSEG